MAGIDLLHVPFRGVAPALNGLYAGDIDLLFSSTIETVPHARDGRLRVLAVGTPQRFPQLPDTPAFGEQLPGYVMTIGMESLRHGAACEHPGPPAIGAAEGARGCHAEAKAAAVGMTIALMPPDALAHAHETEGPR